MVGADVKLEMSSQDASKMMEFHWQKLLTTKQPGGEAEETGCHRRNILYKMLPHCLYDGQLKC
jgi:hypothetical protein